MSGGSYQYIFSKIDDLAKEIKHQDIDPRRATLAKVVELLGKAMHDVEWVDSDDYAAGDDHKALDALFGALGQDSALVAKAHAYDALRARMLKFFRDDGTKAI